VQYLPPGFLTWSNIENAVLWRLIWGITFSVPVRVASKWLLKLTLDKRQEIAFWLTVPLTLTLAMLAMSFGPTPISLDQKLTTLQGAVDQLNARLTPRHLTPEQKVCLKQQLSKNPGQVRFAWAGANYEAFQYAEDLDGVAESDHWKVAEDGNMFYHYNGLSIIVNDKTAAPAATVFRDAFSTCHVLALWRTAPDVPPNDFRLYIGPKG
jgi:hypothetical protein